MPTFIDVHDGMHGTTQQDLEQAHQADLDIEGEESVHFERAWVDPESGKAFCLSHAPSKEAVQRIHERAGHPPTEVYQISAEV